MKNSINILEEYLLGTAAKEVLTKARVAAEKKWKVHAESQASVFNILLKLKKCLLTNFMPVKYASAFNPINMTENLHIASRRFTQLADNYSLLSLLLPVLFIVLSFSLMKCYRMS